MRRGLWIALLLTASCKDEGVERHRKALDHYGACIAKGAPPADPCFDEVLTVLQTVPKSSSAREKSNALRDGLLTARQPKVRTPLAIQGSARLPNDVIEQLKQCQKLAEQLGTTPEAERGDALRALEACRARAEKLDDAHVHDEGDGGAG
jgi:hypothetical protein